MIYSAAFIAGTIFGSFFYTLSLRFARGMFSEQPGAALLSRSACPHCGTAPAALYMIPVLGWFFCLGKCSSCGKRISLMYPLWEVIFGLMAILVIHVTGMMPATFFIYMICCVSVSIGIIDYMTMKIPDSLIVVFALLSLYPVIQRGEYLDSFYGFLLLSVFFLVVLLVFPGSFGFGDLKFYAAAGFLFGLEQSLVLLEVTLVGGALCGVVWGLLKGGTLRQKMPFAPFISAGIIITLLYGGRIALYYYSIMY